MQEIKTIGKAITSTYPHFCVVSKTKPFVKLFNEKLLIMAIYVEKTAQESGRFLGVIQMKFPKRNLRVIKRPAWKIKGEMEDGISKEKVTKIVKLNPEPAKRFLRISFFIRRISQLIEENLDDDQYGIAQICRDAGTSRTQLHKNIKKYTNMSTSIFIRSIRLQYSKSLLEKTDLNISQVAYEVGFRDPRYFSRLFSEQYHQSPRDYRKNFTGSGANS